MLVKLFKISLTFTLILLGFVISLSYRTVYKPISHSKSNDYITIQKGSSIQEISTTLVNEGIIKNDYAFLLYIKFRGLGPKLKAGDYRFPSPISPLEVISRLQEGQQKSFRFTVIEGWTRWDIANALLKIPEFSNRNISQILTLMNDTTKIHGIDSQAENLEGFLYPDTYYFPLNSSLETVINSLTDKSISIWNTETLTRAKILNQTPRQILTIASMIETEAKLAEERPIIASVIYNRLAKKMPLGIDSTIIYASKLIGKWKYDGKIYRSDLDLKSPYNTRINVGLPPGPIASPSASSVKAALNPSQTDYLFYVRNPERIDGTHNFYNNDLDFQKGVTALRNWEKQQLR